MTWAAGSPSIRAGAPTSPATPARRTSPPPQAPSSRPSPAAPWTSSSPSWTRAAARLPTRPTSAEATSTSATDRRRSARERLRHRLHRIGQLPHDRGRPPAHAHRRRRRLRHQAGRERERACVLNLPRRERLRRGRRDRRRSARGRLCHGKHRLGRLPNHRWRPQPTFGGGSGGDAFVTKLDASESGLAYSTYLGGSGQDFGTGIAIDPRGSAYVTGAAASADFPTTAGAYQPALADFYDAFVAKITPAPNGRNR